MASACAAEGAQTVVGAAFSLGGLPVSVELSDVRGGNGTASGGLALHSVLVTMGE